MITKFLTLALVLASLQANALSASAPTVCSATCINGDLFNWKLFAINSSGQTLQEAVTKLNIDSEKKCGKGFFLATEMDFKLKAFSFDLAKACVN